MECTKFTSHVKGSLKGFANIFVEKWGVDIPGFQLCMKDGKRWINFPSSMYEKDGVKKYAPFMTFRDKYHQETFLQQIKDAIDDYCKIEREKEINNSGKESEPPTECFRV